MKKRLGFVSNSSSSSFVTMDTIVIINRGRQKEIKKVVREFKEYLLDKLTDYNNTYAKAEKHIDKFMNQFTKTDILEQNEGITIDIEVYDGDPSSLVYTGIIKTKNYAEEYEVLERKIKEVI